MKPLCHSHPHNSFNPARSVQPKGDRQSPWTGAVSPIIFIFVLVIALLMWAAGMGLRSLQREYTSVRMKEDQTKSMREDFLYGMSEALLPVLYEALAPLPNSPHGDLEDAMNRAAAEQIGESTDAEQFSWDVEDISSRLPMNWVHPKLLEQDELSSLFQDGAGSGAFRDARGELGPVLDFQAGYGELLSREAVETLTSAYAPANINVSYPDSIRQLAQIRTGDSSFADRLFERIQQGLIDRTIWKEEELSELLNPYTEQLQGLMTTRGMMNVNYVPEEILLAVLYYPYGDESIPEFRGAFDEILTLRKRQAIDEVLLKDMLSLEEVLEDRPLAQRVIGYLGDCSWFWKLSLHSGELTLEIRIARLAAGAQSTGAYRDAESSGKSTQTEFQIISQRIIDRE